MKLPWSLILVVASSLATTGCVPDEQSLQSPAWDSPVSYVPPPENVPPVPAGNSGNWIGPEGYSKDR